MYQPTKSKVSFPDLEKEMLDFWQKENIFAKSLKLSKKEHIFYDGPPFPTGSPHHGTIFVSILKDSIARFFTMMGYTVPRRWGWDCHGLPIENMVEKKLGIKNKAEIETDIGVEIFNNECRQFVSDCNDSWKEYIDKIGRWVEYDNPYRTLDTDYMESVLWIFKECHDKGLIYKDYRITPYCYHCETALSISDTRESDSTRPRQDPEVVVRFRAQKDIAGMPAYFLAWTTTPWTLTANLALAVGASFDYAAVEKNGAVYLLAAAALARMPELFGESPKVLATCSGASLVGQSYTPLFPYYQNEGKKEYFKVLRSDHVTLEDGVGIVHIAPAFGEEDYWLCRKNSITVQNPVNARGCFEKIVKEFAGRNVHEANGDIIRFLKKEVLLRKIITHNYPHCWRCRSPLIYKAMEAWYFAVEKLKEKLIQNNKKVNWVPHNVKEGRFGKWLEGARDWNISRSRYWGTPIPVWECTGKECHKQTVLGSIAEIESHSQTKLTDLHKEHLDKVVIVCKSCGSPMERVSEVLDCWFESGSMPYGQCHYPFASKEWFETHFPCDFIVEYPGQIRGWFYYLHVISTALFDRPAFRNCVVHGTLLAEDGAKISKSKKNYTDPMELVNRYGADAMRIYLISSPAATMADLRFSDAGIVDQTKGVLLPLWNSYSYFVTYANIDRFQGDPDHVPNPGNKLDRWILAVLSGAEKEIRKGFCSYQLNRTLNPILGFIENLTNWYIRRSRNRFWASGMNKDKREAFETLYYVLVTLVKVLAPSMPFLSDYLYRNLTGRESVHLAAWPSLPDNFRDDKLVEEVEVGRKIAAMGLSLRQKIKVKVRQPLAAIKVVLPGGMNPEDLKEQVEVIKDELNVKSVVFTADVTNLASLRGVPNSKVLGPKYGRQMQQIVKAAREGRLREEADKVVVFDDDKSWSLRPEDIKIGYEGKDGCDVISQDGILVSLTSEITPELREEGIANELNRLIQDLRKKAGYQISDKIDLTIIGRLDGNLARNLADNALAWLITMPEKEAEFSESKVVADRAFTIRIRRRYK